MLKMDTDAVICDFQQYYNVDLYEVAPSRAAVLAWGLPEDSRIKKEINKTPADVNTILLASMVDRLSFIAWTKTKDAEKHRNRPQSILANLYKKDNDTTAFATSQDFEAARRRIIEG